MNISALKKYFSTTVDSDIARNSIDEAFELFQLEGKQLVPSSQNFVIATIGSGRRDQRKSCEENRGS